MNTTNDYTVPAGPAAAALDLIERLYGRGAELVIVAAPRAPRTDSIFQCSRNGLVGELIRPGVSGEFFCWEGWARGSEVIEAVSGGVKGAGSADGGRSARWLDLRMGGDGAGR